MEWAEGADPAAGGIADAWLACPRGDWLLGFAVRLGAERRALVAAAGAAAGAVLDLLPEGEDRPAKALATLSGWAANGPAEESSAAFEESERALDTMVGEAPDPTVAEIGHAVLAALACVREPEAAPMAATHAVQAAVFDAGDCAMLAAMRYAQEQTADRVREHLDAAWAHEAFSKR